MPIKTGIRMEIRMTNIILAVAFVAEAVFATYCIITKSNQRRVRSFVRIGALTTFVLLTLVSIIRWSFRWYGLAALLSIWAMLGAWALIGKKAEKDSYKARSIVRRAIQTLLLVCLAISPALIFPQYRPPKVTGKYEVATEL
jgi:hypothetical protein